ncbi:galactosylceramide sulfotransferase-like isoform X2 [Artemia franciscana]|uniref:Uncharacterized protein n=1 Tax=Artemia franciscana TaxID=6661 RepID=A0AA88L898_ARTSF|nr:hypothetical protein QYM36_012799 [Artemia franciscana]
MKIVFAKSFKVSGTTVADILLKLSYFYGSYYDWKSKSIAFKDFETSISGNISNFDIFVEDERWNFANIKKLIGEDSNYVTILRNPVDQFESMFHFMDLREHYNVSSFEMFLNKLENNTIKDNRLLNFFGRNQLSFTLGFEPELFENDTAIDKFINEIDNQFNLVMISDYFDESIILLKNLLRSHIGQMLYVPKLRRRTRKKHKISEKETVLLQKWLKADVKLYNTFRRKLERSLTNRVRQEAKTLQKLNSNLQDFCKAAEFFPPGKDSSQRFGTYELHLIRSHRSQFLHLDKKYTLRIVL